MCKYMRINNTLKEAKSRFTDIKGIQLCVKLYIAFINRFYLTFMEYIQVKKLT